MLLGWAWDRIRIWDNGPGIEEDRLSSVFDFGYSGKGAAGLGLGLPYVESIVEASGGWVDVESRWGKWTEFRLTLPASNTN